MVLKVTSRFLHTAIVLHKKVPHNLKGKGVSSAQWLTRQLSDPYVDKANVMNYRCRSAFKLLETDNRFKIFKPGQVVVDCGAAPGSWTQVAVERVNPNGIVIAIDKQPIHPIPGAILLGNSDFTLEQTQAKIHEKLDKRKVDVVISDMAPSATGMKELDGDNIIKLCYLVLRFAVLVSNVGGTLLVKIWASRDSTGLEKDIKRFYNNVRVVKPDASRSDSAETYLLAREFKGLKENITT